MRYLCIFLLMAFNSFAAEIIKFNGNIEINGKKIESKQEVFTGDKVSAIGKKSFVIIRYKDGSRFLFKDGQLIIKSVNEDSKENKLSLIKGLIYSFTQPNSDNKFEVATKAATMGVRGTKFWLKVDGDESYLCVCDGKVEVTNKKNSVLVSRNQDITVHSSSEKLNVSPPSKLMWSRAISGFKELELQVKDR